VFPIQQLTGGVLAQILRRQPSSPGRTQFAWQLAVGPALARSTTVTLRDGVLNVRAADERWGREIERASGIVLGRLQQLLGPEIVRAVRVER
jgi:predicted nucleic acid-binding Zn ribbon protein